MCNIHYELLCINCTILNIVDIHVIPSFLQISLSNIPHYFCCCFSCHRECKFLLLNLCFPKLIVLHSTYLQIVRSLWPLLLGLIYIVCLTFVIFLLNPWLFSSFGDLQVFGTPWWFRGRWGRVLVLNGCYLVMMTQILRISSKPTWVFFFSFQFAHTKSIRTWVMGAPMPHGSLVNCKSTFLINLVINCR